MMKPLSEVTGAGWKCQHDYFSYQALVLALTEFAVPKVSAAGMAGTRFLLLGKVATKLAAKEGFIGKVFKKIKPKAGWREEFKLEKNIIHVIYFQARPHALLPPTFHHPHVVISHASAPRPAIHFQALLWFMQPFFPFGAVLGPILLFLDYKWEVLELVRFSRKSNKPFNAGASTLYFLYCYIFTGMLFCVFWGASFLFADALTTGANACGPYKSAAAAAFDTLKTEASADADVFKVLFDFFLEPRYLWAALLAVYLLAAVRGSRAVVLAEFVEVQQGASPSSLSLSHASPRRFSPLYRCRRRRTSRRRRCCSSGCARSRRSVTSRGRSRGGSARRYGGARRRRASPTTAGRAAARAEAR
jgi:hypothetical protein